MDNKALNYAYNLFTNDGYTDSIEDFGKLIASNPEALNYAHSLFKKDGYTDSIDDFKDLVVSEPKTIKEIDTSKTGLLLNVIQETQPGFGNALGMLSNFAKGLVDIADMAGDVLETGVQLQNPVSAAKFLATRRAAAQAGISSEEFDKTDPYNFIELKGLSDVLDKAVVKYKDKDTGKYLDFVDLAERGESKKASNAFLMEFAGAAPSMLVSMVPGGYALLGAGSFAETFNRDLVERPDETMENIFYNSVVYGGSDAIGEALGGKYLRAMFKPIANKGGNKISGRVKDAVVGGVGGFVKTAFKGGSVEAMQEAITSVIQTGSNDLIYGDEKTGAEYFRKALHAGIIGFALGGSAGTVRTGMDRNNKTKFYEYLAPKSYKNQQTGLALKVEEAQQDLDNAPADKKEKFQRRLDNVKKKQDDLRDQLYNRFENMDKADLELMIEKIQEQHDNLDIITGGRNYSESAKDQAKKDFKEAADVVGDLFAVTDVDYDSGIELELSKYFKVAEDIDKINENLWFKSKDLDYDYVDNQEKYDELKKKYGKDIMNSAEGFFEVMEDGKRKIFINRDVAAMQSATNVIGHEVLHYAMSHRFANDPKFLRESVVAFNKYLDEVNPYIKKSIERRLANPKNGYAKLDADGKVQRDEDGLIIMKNDSWIEEYFTMFSDLIKDEKIDVVEEASTGIKNNFRTMIRGLGLGFDKVDFKNGKEVFDLLIDYNKNIGRTGLLGKITQKKAVETVAGKKVKEVEAGIKKSVTAEQELAGDKSFETEIQESYEKGDLDAIQEAYKPRIKRVLRAEWSWTEENKDKFDAIVEEAVGPDRGVLQLILGPGKTKYDPTLGVPLSGHIGSVFQKRGLREFVRREYPEGVIEQQMGKESVAKEVAKIETKPQDVILTKKVLDQYKTPLLSGFTFVKEQIKTLRDTVSKIVGGYLPDLNATISKNKSVSPLIADMKAQLYVKNGPIHKMVYDLMTTEVEVLTQEYLKKTNPKTKKLYTLKDAKNQAFKDSVEAFFKNTKYKKAILDSLTTTWLAKHLPAGVQKKVVGIGWVNHDVWKGRKKGAKKGNIEAWQASEEGPYKGMTDGKQKIRRNPKIMTDVSPAMLLSAFVKGETATDIKRGGLENISLAITQEIGLETFKADMINDGSLKALFKGRYELIYDRLLNDNFVDEFVRQSERGTTKFSRSNRNPIKFSKNQVEKALADPTKMRKVVSKERDYWQKLFDKLDLDLKAIDWNNPDDVQEYRQFILDVAVPIFPYEFFTLPNTGTFYGVRGPKNYQLTRTKSEFVEVLDNYIKTIAKEKGIPFEAAKSQLFNIGIKDKNDNFIIKPLTKKEIQNVLDSIKRVKYGDSKEKGVKQKLTDTKFKESSKKGTKIIWNIIEKVQQADKRTIRGFSAMLQSSSANMGHFMRTSATIEGANTLSSPNREEHSNPITGVSKWNQIHAILGVLIDGGIYDKSMKNHIQISLPIFMDDRFKGVDKNGNKYDYSEFPPSEVGLAVYKGEIHPFVRMYHPNVNNNFTYDQETVDKMSREDVKNGEHLIPGVNPNVLITAEGKTHAQFYKVDVDQKLLNVSPKNTEAFARKIQIVQAQQDLIYRIIKGDNVTPTQIKNTLNGVINAPLKAQVKETKTLEKSIAFSRSAKNESKGITVLDFDDTLATTESLVKFTTPEGETGTLNAEQYASTYEDLLDQGYTFDFSDFNKVVKGKLAPLFNKAMKLQDKFGPENMFVLTARPPAAQKAIFDFLKANGLNIPLKNITGLGNSTAEAKALWIADKVGEGYNDFYFADDALQNVQAVKNMLDQFDVKSKVQQAKVKFSKSMNKDFNDILENVTGIESKKRFSAVKARKRGESKGKFRFFIPPSHEDFVGLLYNFIGKGKEGNKHRDFFEQALIRPLNRAFRELNAARQSIANDYKSLNKQFKNVKKKLNKKTPDGDFTYQDAIRVYLWDKHGHNIPGLTPTDQQNLVDLVKSDPELQNYAETLNVISKREDYVKPSEGWEVTDIRMDLDDATGRIGRADFLAEFLENADIIFSPENLNKIEAAYGPDMVSAIKDMLYRIETGRNRPSGQNKIVNGFMNWFNSSVAATMFINVRSVVLQQMSLVNFINYSDNNILAAAKAFANQKQYWKDFAFLFNSDFMKQRRGGIKTDVNGAELAESLKGAKNNPITLLNKLLQLGFKPTQIGDNIAIATGGAPYYRNRINTYLKQGLSQKEAEAKAFVDFQVLAEATQQSARPDMVSQQQASPLGKVILAFQNVTSQFNRLGKKAFLDIKNRRISPEYKNASNPQLQSDMSNLSRIAYYFAIQNLIFYTLQSALFMAMFDDDEDDKQLLRKKERVINGSIDSVLRGTGVWGAVVATLKNMARKRFENQGKDWRANEYSVLAEALQVSPPLGSRARKLVKAERELIWDKKVIKEMETFDIENPLWPAVTNYVEGTTNAPLNRSYNLTLQAKDGLDNQFSALQRVLRLGGWGRWDVGIEDVEKSKKKEKFGGKKKTKKKEFKRKFIR